MDATKATPTVVVLAMLLMGCLNGGRPPGENCVPVQMMIEPSMEGFVYKVFSAKEDFSIDALRYELKGDGGSGSGRIANLTSNATFGYRDDAPPSDRLNVGDTFILHAAKPSQLSLWLGDRLVGTSGGCK